MDIFASRDAIAREAETAAVKHQWGSPQCNPYPLHTTVHSLRQQHFAAELLAHRAMTPEATNA